MPEYATRLLKPVRYPSLLGSLEFCTTSSHKFIQLIVFKHDILYLKTFFFRQKPTSIIRASQYFQDITKYQALHFKRIHDSL